MALTHIERGLFCLSKKNQKKLYIICISIYNRYCNKEIKKRRISIMSIAIPPIVWLPALVWIVTYELTKHHGIKRFLKENTDFYGVTTDDEAKGRK